MRPLVLILRPQPGAAETAARADAMGLEPIVAPLFVVRPLAWSAPDPGGLEAVMITSANAARHGGPQLGEFAHLPCYAVGEASAAAARAAGFGDIRIGPANAAALAAMMVEDGIHAAFHPAGLDTIATGGLTLTTRVVYKSEPVDALSAEARSAIALGALVLLHSPRAAATFARIWRGDRGGVALAAISAEAARAAGTGWKAVAFPERPRDQALLELAAKLCQTEGQRDAEGNADGL